ncbi:MAG: chromosome segregation protein SMC [Firmicutes bacterium]|nr:chromosome segregation protein SMC [Bacillota bacterium]
MDLYFKKIELQGFKSFAEPVTIEFQDGITCIVGPNGSGKSNISDAIRWVLGEQSPKMLRGGKMEEVIFAGTASRKSRGMAEVTLTIDNSTHFLPIDYTEVAITRRMYRSGESEYLINKTPCRLRDIRELIMDTGIGVDGYSIIGQGKIADIVSNKTESRREIFEEAAGIVKYRSKKAESERKLESGRVNLERVNDIISEIESRLHGLEQDSEKAKEYLDLRERYKAVEINVILKNIESIELKNEYLRDDIAESALQIQNTNEEKESLDQEVSAVKNRNQELETLSEEKRTRLMACAAERNDLFALQRVREERLRSIEKESLRLRDELEELLAKQEKEKNNRAELELSKAAAAQELLDLNGELRRQSDVHEELQQRLRNAAADIEAGRDEIYRLNSLASAKRGEISSLKGMDEALQRRKQQVKEEQERSRNAEQDLEQSYRDAVSRRELLRAEMAELDAERNRKQRAQAEIFIKQKQCAEQLESIKLESGRSEARRKVIDEMEHAYEGYSRGVRFIMRSGIAGLLGTVADLIQVPVGYETAVETALGAMVQNIVCKDQQSAQDAIAALKREKAGRLTFLPVSGIRSGTLRRDDTLSGETGFRGYGVDCITFDEKYRNVMEYLLGRVIIVDRLDHAIRLSKKRSGSGLRFVTIEGEVINSGGAITGGASKNNTSGFLERKAEAARLEEQIAALEEQWKRVNREMTSVNQEQESIAEDLEKLLKRHRETELKLLSAENEITVLTSKQAETETEKEKYERELARIHQEGESAVTMIRSLQEESEEAQRSAAALEEAAAEKLSAYGALQAETDKIGSAVAELRLQAGAAQGKLSGLEQLFGRIGDYVNELNRQREAKQETLETLKSQEKELTESEAGLQEQLAEKDEEQTKLEAELRLAQDERIRLNRELEELEKRKEETDSLLLGYQNTRHELEMKLAKQEMQEESYKARLWEDFEVSYVQAIAYQKSDFVMAEAVRESRELKSRLKALGDVNIGAIQEFETVKERYDFLTEQREDLNQGIDALVHIIEDMDRSIRRSFKESFEKIADNFQFTFEQLFGGGTAELRLEDESMPLECGIEIVAQPPGKKLQNINLLSGGEKTMTAIALMFAVLRAKPTPFCILDEIEAALDEVNIERVAKYLRDFTDVQFALITHQKATMEYANALYGVTMPERGISKVLSLRLGDNFDL